jgi:glucokinase
VPDHLFLGLEIGGTKLQLGLGQGDGRILALERLDVRNRADGKAHAEDIRAQLSDALGPLLGRLGARRQDVRAVGVGFGGPVDHVRGVVTESFQVIGWNSFPLAAWIAKVWGVSTVWLHNDADTAGLAEARFGAGVGLSPIVYVTVGSGIGGGLIVNGQIYRGFGAGAMEIGHLRTSKPAVTVEELASGWSIAKRAQFELDQKIATDPSYMSPLRTVLGPHGGHTHLTAQKVAGAAEEGDEIALPVLAQATTALGRALAQVVTLLAPRRIILGGGVSLILEDLWLKPLRDELDRWVFPSFRGGFDIVPAQLGEEVVVHGALALARDAFAAQ